MHKKKSLNRPQSSATLRTQKTNEPKPDSAQKILSEVELPPSDNLILKVFSVRVSDLQLRNFALKVTFLDQLLLYAIIKPIGARDQEPANPIANGSMMFDPSDYEKMCLFANSPLVAQIQPLRNIDKNRAINEDQSNLDTSERTKDISCCNVDIIPIFTDMKENQKICIKKRMEPMILPPASKRKSWDTLPLLSMELTIERNPVNEAHHKVLEKANWMKLTLIAAYNMITPFENDYVYTAASKIPTYNDDDSQVGLVTYSQGYKEPRGFNCTSLFPKWESLRALGEPFTQSDRKIEFTLEDIQNEDNIDLPYYLDGYMPEHTVVWGSFHRTLMLKGDKCMWTHFCQYKWPLEVHIYGENDGYSFMAFLNLFQLLYPGEQRIRMAVPLQWINSETMMEVCGCELLLTPNEAPPASLTLSGPDRGSKASRVPDTAETSVSAVSNIQNSGTGVDGNNAFVVLEIELGRPLKPAFKPPEVLKQDIYAMLTEMELKAPKKRICTGRGQQEREWRKTVRNAANSLRKVPYYGATEFCTFNRQLSETRTRVELTTSCWQDAAIFVNNHFVVQEYLDSDEAFEELIMMSHACLMKSASTTLIRPEKLTVEEEPALRAARHARQMQDMHHAKDIFLRLIVDNRRNADYWRELSTCLKDVDREAAQVCLNKAVFLNPRHPLSLLSKGAMLFEENPVDAEPFFIALLIFYPNWASVWVIASVYFYERELFHLAEVIMSIAMKERSLQCREEGKFLRCWEKELGDWWDSAPLPPDFSPYYDAADLLLRLRAIPLAEVCLARVLSTEGESPQYYHLVGLCCRLRGDLKEALCHINIGLEKYGEVNYLRSLEAEVHHKLGNFEQSSVSFAKVDDVAEPFTALMSLASGDKPRARAILLDGIRTRPNAYAWVALAEDWLAHPPPVSTTSVRVKISKKELDIEAKATDASKDTGRQLKAKTSAIACAIQALKIDRQAGRAWAILARHVRPKAKRMYCLKMARISGWRVTQHDIDKANVASQYSICHNIGTSLRECCCGLCEYTRV